MARKITKPKYEIVGVLEKFAEADNAQARGELVSDSALWKAYYQKYPDLEELGRKWLALPGIGKVGPIEDTLMLGSIMGTIALMSKDEDLDGEPATKRVEIPAERATEKIKGLARHLGADLVGVGPLNQAWVYSHVGRAHYPGKIIGPEIQLPHCNAIVVVMHLNRNMVLAAPQLPIVLEVMRTYVQLASIANTVARYIRMLGYSARAHDLHNYQVLAVPIAIDAGLGELGRNGVLINEKYGNAIKMAVVTTDIPLVHDKPVDIGVGEFCRDCTICGQYCPVGAIPIKQEKKVVRGVRKWKINDAACYSYWRTVGTDCGICLAVCPWSRPRHFPHNVVQTAVECSGLLRRVAIWADTLIKKRRTGHPVWMEEQPELWKEGLRRGHPFR